MSEEQNNYQNSPISSYTVVRRTWLSQKLDQIGVLSSAVATLFLVLGSFAYLKNFANAREWMPASFNQVFINHEYWRAWSTLFAHADIKHVLSNSFLFFILGSFLAGHFGLFIFPLLAFVMGGVTNLLVLQDMNVTTHLIGASGIVFWLGGFWLTLYLLLDTRRTLTQRMFRSVGVGLLLFMPSEAFDPSISYEAHFTGFLLGVLCGLIYYRYKKSDFKSAEVSETIYEFDYMGIAPR